MQYFSLPNQNPHARCGMLNYPSSGDIIAVQGVRKKEDCRAYRVFEYYIETLIADLEGEGLTRDEAEDRVFYARREDESNPHQPLRVFACSTCKAKCAMQVRLTLVLPSLPCASPAMLLPLLYLAARAVLPLFYLAARAAAGARSDEVLPVPLARLQALRRPYDSGLHLHRHRRGAAPRTRRTDHA